MKNECEDLAAILDETLGDRPQGSMKDLAESLAARPDADLSELQIYRKISEFRSTVAGGHTFNLACAILETEAGLLREVARRAGFCLVEKPADSADLQLTAAQAAAEAIQSEGATVAAFLEHIRDGVYTDEEFAELQRLVRDDHSANERILLVARTIRSRAAGVAAPASATKPGAKKGTKR